MTILIFNWRDIKHPLGGGAEISLFEHAKHWAAMKSTVIWFTSSFPNAKPEEVIDGVRFIRRGSLYTVHLLAFFYYLRGIFGKPDLIIDCFHFIPFFTPLYSKSDKIIGLINEVAGRLWFDNLVYPLAYIGYHLESTFFYFYKKCLFITGSESTKEELVKIGLSEKKINVVHHGIKTITVSKTIQKERDPVIVFLGRISQDKGIEEVLDVFLLIRKNVKNVRLWIIGKEEKLGMMESLLKTLQMPHLKNSIKYFGFVSEEKKFELLKKAWILIHPSKKEGWGLNVIEAATQGTPTVGYNVEGLRDSVLHGKTGMLVAPNQPMLLVDAIQDLFSSTGKNRYQQMSQNAVQWSKNFNWTVSTKQSWEVLKHAYEGRKEKE